MSRAMSGASVLVAVLTPQIFCMCLPHRPWECKLTSTCCGELDTVLRINRSLDFFSPSGSHIRPDCHKEMHSLRRFPGEDSGKELISQLHLSPQVGFITDLQGAGAALGSGTAWQQEDLASAQHQWCQLGHEGEECRALSLCPVHSFTAVWAGA